MPLIDFVDFVEIMLKETVNFCILHILALPFGTRCRHPMYFGILFFFTISINFIAYQKKTLGQMVVFIMHWP